MQSLRLISSHVIQRGRSGFHGVSGLVSLKLGSSCRCFSAARQTTQLTWLQDFLRDTEAAEQTLHQHRSQLRASLPTLGPEVVKRVAELEKHTAALETQIHQSHSEASALASALEGALPKALADSSQVFLDPEYCCEDLDLSDGGRTVSKTREDESYAVARVQHHVSRGTVREVSFCIEKMAADVYVGVVPCNNTALNAIPGRQNLSNGISYNASAGNLHQCDEPNCFGPSFGCGDTVTVQVDRTSSRSSVEMQVIFLKNGAPVGHPICLPDQDVDIAVCLCGVGTVVKLN